MRFRLIAACLVLAATLAGCGSSGGSSSSSTTAPAATSAGAATGATQAPASNVTLTMYNAQHEDLVKAMVAGFTADTGIKVDVRSGKDFELANQIAQEGSNSPADVFITENSPAMQVVAAKNLFAPVDKETLAQVPTRFSPVDGSWVGVAARVTVLVYNPKMLTASDMPASIMDLSTSKWKDRVAIATGADFQAIASAVLAIKGQDAAEGWLKGLKSNAKVYSGNGAVMKAVNDGVVPAGIIYHYYWYKDRAESGANSANTELYFFPNKDPGGFVSVSGLGVLKSSKHPKEAQLLLKYMTGAKGQKVLADSSALEYTVNANVPPNSKLKPFAEMSIPDVDITKLNGPIIIELMQKVGLL